MLVGGGRLFLFGNTKEVGKKMLKIAICDDEKVFRAEMDKKLQHIAGGKQIEVEHSIYEEAEALLHAVIQGEKFDLIFLDIEMGKQNGISIAKQLRAYDRHVLLIYVSGYEHYIKDSFQVQPFRFLCKPVNDVELEQCWCDAYREITTHDVYFRYVYNRVHYKMKIQEILYFESNRRKITLHTEKGEFETYDKLDEIERKIKKSNGNFLRIHKSYLVNYKHIQRLGYDFVELDNGVLLNIAQDKRKKIGQAYCLLEEVWDD